jgi:hypothetical protein
MNSFSLKSLVAGPWEHKDLDFAKKLRKKYRAGIPLLFFISKCVTLYFQSEAGSVFDCEKVTKKQKKIVF